MTTKLPPWNKMELDCLNATLKDAGYSIENRRDILRRCEMHDGLVEAVRTLYQINEDQGMCHSTAARNVCLSVLKEVSNGTV